MLSVVRSRCLSASRISCFTRSALFPSRGTRVCASDEWAMGYCRRSAGPSGSRRPTQRTQRRRGAPILAPSRCRHARRSAAESSALLTNRRRSSPPRDATAEPISVGWCKARRCAGALGKARGHAGGRRQHKCRWSAPQHSVARALRAPLLDAANTRCYSLRRLCRL